MVDYRMCHFKEMEEVHLHEVLDIFNYYVLNTTATFDTEPLTLDKIRKSVIHRNVRYKSFVIMDGQSMKGYVLISPYKLRQAYDLTAEVTIYLKPEYIGQGIGKRSLEFIEDIGKQNGFHVIIATISTENERSMRLFKDHGYVKCAHYKEIGYKFGRFLDVTCYQKILNNVREEDHCEKSNNSNF